MKTLILYATKHGATEEIARRIAKYTDGTIHDLKNDNYPPLSEFECIIIGSALYAGMIRKEAKTFIEKNAEYLKDKTFGLFLCGLETNKTDEYFKINFPADIIKSAKATSFLGGIFDPKKAGFIGRLVMKAVAKRADYMNTIDDGKIRQFVEDLNCFNVLMESIYEFTEDLFNDGRPPQ